MHYERFGPQVPKCGATASSDATARKLNYWLRRTIKLSKTVVATTILKLPILRLRCRYCPALIVEKEEQHKC